MILQIIKAKNITAGCHKYIPNPDIECTVSFKAIRLQWLYFEFCLLLKYEIHNNSIKQEKSAKNTLQ